MKKPKILEKGESTFKNGGGNICGGIMSKTDFYEGGVEGNMMAYYMEDDKFAEYKEITDEKEKDLFFEKHAKSFI